MLGVRLCVHVYILDRHHYPSWVMMLNNLFVGCAPTHLTMLQSLLVQMGAILVQVNRFSLHTEVRLFSLSDMVSFIVLLNDSFLACCIISVYSSFDAHCNPVIFRMVTITVECNVGYML